MNGVRKALSILFVLVFVLTVMPANGVAAKTTKVSLNKTSLTLTSGASYRLKLSNTKTSIKWSSSDTKVARVNQKGLVSAVVQGSAVITAKAGNQKYSCKVTVNAKDSTAAYQKLAAYITEHGETNKAGNKATVIYADKENYSSISYLPGTNSVVFSITTSLFGKEGTMDMIVHLNNSAKPEVDITVKEADTSYEAEAVFDAAAYESDVEIPFTVKTYTNYQEEDIQEDANGYLLIGLMCWDYQMLYNSDIDLTMSDLGFVWYEGML